MATKDYKYTDATPVDDPVSKPKPPKPTPKPPKPTPKPAPKPPVMYPDSVPVDDPVVNKRKGGSIKGFRSSANGIAQRGKTRGTMVMCGGGMAKRK